MLSSVKAREVRDTSLRVPHGGDGIVHDVKYFSRRNGDDLSPGVNEVIRIYIVQKRKISEEIKWPDAMVIKGLSQNLTSRRYAIYARWNTSGYHVKPIRVPSRMNIGQILEIH